MVVKDRCLFNTGKFVLLCLSLRAKVLNLMIGSLWTGVPQANSADPDQTDPAS